jgi:hypothetical protein
LAYRQALKAAVKPPSRELVAEIFGDLLGSLDTKEKMIALCYGHKYNQFDPREDEFKIKTKEVPGDYVEAVKKMRRSGLLDPVYGSRGRVAYYQPSFKGKIAFEVACYISFPSNKKIRDIIPRDANITDEQVMAADIWVRYFREAYDAIVAQNLE